MTENRRQILDMLAQGKINVDEAERLLSLVDPPSLGCPGGYGANWHPKASAQVPKGGRG